jgi:hypothetical protein
MVYHARKSAKNSQSFSSLSKIMNNGDAVTKKDFTASFKSKKRRGFLII